MLLGRGSRDVWRAQLSKCRHCSLCHFSHPLNNYILWSQCLLTMSLNIYSTFSWVHLHYSKDMTWFIAIFEKKRELESLNKPWTGTAFTQSHHSYYQLLPIILHHNERTTSVSQKISLSHGFDSSKQPLYYAIRTILFAAIWFTFICYLIGNCNTCNRQKKKKNLKNK